MQFGTKIVTTDGRVFQILKEGRRYGFACRVNEQGGWERSETVRIDVAEYMIHGILVAEVWTPLTRASINKAMALLEAERGICERPILRLK